MGLENKGSIGVNLQNIIITLIKDYRYIGTYDYEHLTMYIKIYKRTYYNDEDDSPDMNAFDVRWTSWSW